MGHSKASTEPPSDPSDPSDSSDPSEKIRAGSAHLASARRTLSLEIRGLEALVSVLDGPFDDTVERLARIAGRVIVTGIGKSGHIARKIAATFASTGTPAQFVHPAEAAHGDLGMITRDDAILAMSWSGESIELHTLIDYSRRFSIPLIAMTAEAGSALAQAADLVLLLPKSEEACPNGLAPTTSTTMQLALGDALAIALLEHKGFTASDYKIFHPGGKLGAILRHVSDIMHTGASLPLAPEDMPMSQALLEMTQKGFGCLGVVDPGGALLGIITDGDLRRHMGDNLLSTKTGGIMTRSPKCVGPDTLVSEALNLMTTSRITSLFVVDQGKPVGLIHVHDSLRIGVA